MLILLSTILVFSGWYLNSLFYGNNAENLWRLVILGNTDFSLKIWISDYCKERK